AQPFRGLCIIRRNASALEIHLGQVTFAGRVVLIGCLAEPFQGLRIVLSDAVAGQVNQTQLYLCVRIPRVSYLFQIGDCLLLSRCLCGRLGQRQATRLENECRRKRDHACFNHCSPARYASLSRLVRVARPNTKKLAHSVPLVVVSVHYTFSKSASQYLICLVLRTQGSQIRDEAGRFHEAFYSRILCCLYVDHAVRRVRPCCAASGRLPPAEENPLRCSTGRL